MKYNVFLAKALQFVCFVMFTFMVLVYFGMLVIIPLDILAIVVRGMSGLGIPLIVALAFGGAALAYVGLRFAKLPEVCRLVIEIGVDLTRFAYAQLCRFDEVIAQLQTSSSQTEATPTTRSAA